ncbi:hypothetical protein I5523_15870 [Acinetobacter oleivorans]|uniref:hypothetical protein n=1 Tax=Acinetobacter oleivorans TaxID=1148157 RepID=UPI001900305D|nr:hypothetical protein [Acinetobacter oleivorans]MBJ9741117.1 hypothetical protein [Acinetobacter oleivorans]
MSSKQQGKAGVVLLIIVVLIVFLASLAISSSWNTDEYTPMVAQAESENKVNTTKSEEIEVSIPISDLSDKGKYFLVSKESKHNGFIIIYKRIGVEQTLFNKYEINCKTEKMRVLGEGDSIDNIKNYSKKGSWFIPISEASTGDTFNFICGRNKEVNKRREDSVKQPFGNLQYKVEPEAVINSKIDEDILSQLILAVLVNGYKCDTVSSAIPYIRGGGYTMQCNNYQYEYEIEDKGGNIIVEVK